MDVGKLDAAIARMDMLSSRMDAWSPEARAAAAEARKKGGASKPTHEAHGTMETSGYKHEGSVGPNSSGTTHHTYSNKSGEKVHVSTGPKGEVKAASTQHKVAYNHEQLRGMLSSGKAHQRDEKVDPIKIRNPDRD
jgi:hypothetical protein